MIFAFACFLGLFSLPAWAFWMLAAGGGLCLVLLTKALAGRIRAAQAEAEMREFAEKRLPRPYTEEEIQVRRRFPLEERAVVYHVEFIYGRFLTEEEMRENIAEHRALEARAADDGAAEERKNDEEKQAEDKLRREMELPENRGNAAAWKTGFDDPAALRRSDGTVLSLPDGLHELSIRCQFEARQEPDYYPKIPAELRIAGLPEMQGVIDLVTLLDLFEVGQVFWWRDQGRDWQKGFQSHVVLGNVGCVEDTKGVLRFKAGAEEVSVYFRRSSYFASLAVVEEQLWARVHALQYLPLDDDGAEFQTLAPFCFPIKAASLPEAWNQEENIVIDVDGK
ncbi:hypothetical protein [Prosthecobacter sp.]|uniref:hypothetical protein n=1 Tax=Prosthecobacter sp. TaxID=1965333 RepID=UPI0037843645